MRYIFCILLFISVSFSAAGAQMRTAGNNERNREEDPDYKKGRQIWIEKMHRAAPDVRTDIIDNETQLSKSLKTMERLRSHRQHTLALEPDTLADGRIIGAWTERGSNNVAGRVHTCDVDWDNNTIYAASSFGNIWKGNLDGSGWTSLNDAWRFRNVRNIKVLQTTKGMRLLVVANSPATVYYSDDDGISWQTAGGLDGPESWGSFRRAVFNFIGDTIITLGEEWDYANSHAVRTIYRSTDYGSTFTNIMKSNSVTWNRTDIWKSPLPNQSTYIIRNDTLGILRGDGSIEYIARQPLADSSGGYYTLKGSYIFGTTTLYLFWIKGSIRHVYGSDNGGIDWTFRGTLPSSHFDRDNSYAVSQEDQAALFMGGVNTYRSWDAGENWERVNDWPEYYPNPENKLHADIPGIWPILDPAGKEYIFVATDGGLYYSEDKLATVKNVMLHQIGSSQYYGVLTSTSSLPHMIYAGAQDQGFQKASDNEAGTLGFTQTISGDYGHLTSSDKGVSVWSNYPGFSMYYPDARNSDFQRGWDFPDGARGLWLPAIIAHPDTATTAFVAAGSQTIANLWRLKYASQRITGESIPFDFSEGDDDIQVAYIAVSPIDARYMYVTTTNGKFFRSSNRGATWTKSDSTFMGGHYFYGSSIVPSRSVLGEVIIGGSGYSNPGVFRSTDHGATFTAINSGLPNTLIYSLAGTPDGEFLFAGTEIGPYIYSREANRWYDMMADKAPDMVYWSVEYIPEIKTVRFGTHGRGIWDFAMTQMRNDVKQKTPTQQITLRSEHLASGDIALAFTLEQSTPIRLRIFDMSGKIIRELNNSSLGSGEHRIIWDRLSTTGTTMASGMYLATLATDEATEFCKILLTR